MRTYVDAIVRIVPEWLTKHTNADGSVFLLRDKRGRVGRNPKTGVEVPIDARRVLVFKPSQVLKERVDSALSKD